MGVEKARVIEGNQTRQGRIAADKLSVGMGQGG